MHLKSVNSVNGGEAPQQIIPQQNIMDDFIKKYYEMFDVLEKKEAWDPIIHLGESVLKQVKQLGRIDDEVKISLQVGYAYANLNQFDTAFKYQQDAKENCSACNDPLLLVRALYFESTLFRLRASRKAGEERQEFYAKAVQTAEEALTKAQKLGTRTPELIATMYYTIAAAYVENPQGDILIAKNHVASAFGTLEKAERGVASVDRLHWAIKALESVIGQRKRGG